MSRYADMLDMERPVSVKHRPMSMTNRAAQFSPFAALTGYSAELEEVERLTEQRREQDEGTRADIDRKLNAFLMGGSNMPYIRILRFVTDERKAGGREEWIDCCIKRLSSAEGILYTTDGEAIPIADILELKVPGNKSEE